MTIQLEEKTWKITRQAPTAAGARATGDYLPVPKESGLWFHSDKGDALFYPIPYDKLPTQEELPDLTPEQILTMMRAAEKRK